MVALSHCKDKHFGVFGLGKAGTATVEALVQGGATVSVWDDNPESARSVAARFHDSVKAVPFDQWDWKNIATLVLAPGVPLTHPKPHDVVLCAQKHDVPVLGDVELLFRECPDATYVGITGTNGKSTTTALIGHILASAGRQVQVGGNLGTAALSFERLGKNGIYVIEMSSYMLDLVASVRFHAGVFLNITPDHLDRHGSMENYVATKMHLFDRQQKSDFSILAVDDAYTEASARQLITRDTATVIPVSVTQKVKDGVWVSDNGILHNDTTQLDLNEAAPRLPGKHNWQNIAAAYAVCRSLALSQSEIAEGISTFGGLAHRMELVSTIQGVRFVNDSKATNADATANALAPYEHIYWILGGKQKEGGIEMLGKFFPKIRHAFIIGTATDEFSKTLEGHVAYTKCGDLRNAFDKAARMGMAEQIENAVVLLSPACASFDQWKSFEHRGDAFRDMTKEFESVQAMGSLRAV
jgi:UDP-N-acetylmuramoylalanine--D-glutamate ligase